MKKTDRTLLNMFIDAHEWIKACVQIDFMIAHKRSTYKQVLKELESIAFGAFDDDLISEIKERQFLVLIFDETTLSFSPKKSYRARTILKRGIIIAAVLLFTYHFPEVSQGFQNIFPMM